MVVSIAGRRYNQGGGSRSQSVPLAFRADMNFEVFILVIAAWVILNVWVLLRLGVPT